jgi:hypothetical protein
MSSQSIRKVARNVLIIGILLVGYSAQREYFKSNYVGEYYFGFEGSGCVLSVNNDKSFSLTHEAKVPGGIEKGKVFHGSYVIQNGFLNLSLQDGSLSEAACLVTRYAFVKWQGRKYLLPYDYEGYAERTHFQQNNFCERIRNREELEHERSGEVLAFISESALKQIDLDPVKDDKPRLFGVFTFCSN